VQPAHRRAPIDARQRFGQDHELVLADRVERCGQLVDAADLHLADRERFRLPIGSDHRRIAVRVRAQRLGRG
jgi:hypothetical protein